MVLKNFKDFKTFQNFKKEYVALAAVVLLFSLLLFGCVQPETIVEHQTQLIASLSPTATPYPSLASSLLPSPSLSPSPSPLPSPALVNVVVTIENGTANYSKMLSVPMDATALSVLESNFLVTKKEYSFGALVTGINGLEQSDSANRYWQYYVDGVLASVGAGDFKITKNALIEWRYEAPPKFE